jgi:NADH-quinone oxidoreductase subunit J
MILGPAAQLLAFTLLSLIALLGALGMATTMSMFRSGIFLMASFIGTAGLFILLSADLLGVLQVMMYIGGMLVMVLFMVLFMHDPGGSMMAGMKLPLVERAFSRGLLPKDEPGGGDPHGHSAHQHAGHDPQPERAQPMGHTDEGTTRHVGHSAAPAHDEVDHSAPAANHDHNMIVHETSRDEPRGGASDANHEDHDPGESRSTEHEHMAAGGMSHEGMDHSGMDMSGMSMVTPVRPWAALLGILTGVFFVVLLLLRPAWPTVGAQPDPNSAEQVGLLLMGKYMMAFEGAGLLILIGIFGAVYLGRPDRHPSASGREARVGLDELPPGLDDDTLKPLLIHDESRPAHKPEDLG